MSIASLLTQLSSAAPALLPVLLDAALKGAVLLLLAAFTAWLLHRASAAIRHLVWFLGIAGLLILPALSLALPAWRILPRWAMNAPTPAPAAQPIAPRISPAPAITLSPPPSSLVPNTSPPTAEMATPAPAPTPPPLHLPWQAWALVAWLAGSAVFLAYMALGFLSLAWLQHRSAPLTTHPWPTLLRQLCAQLRLRRPVRLLTSPRRTMPMTWGLWRPRLLLPADCDSWTDQQRQAVVLHELAHAKRRDCLTQCITQLACALYWFNPLVWLAWQRMQAERERACDDLVLAAGTKASAYAEHLLHIASALPTPRIPAAAIAMARPSKLEERLVAILDTTRNRRTVTWGAGILAVLLVGAFVVPVAMLRTADDGIRSEATATRMASPASANRSATEALTFPTRASAQIIADLKAQRLPFLSDTELMALETQFRTFLISQPEPDPVVSEAILKSLHQYVPLYFSSDPDDVSADSLETIYLTFADRVATLQRKLRLALTRPPLSSKEIRRRAAQRQWLHDYINTVPEPDVILYSTHKQPGQLRAQAISDLDANWSDPLDFSAEPWSDARFQALQRQLQPGGDWASLWAKQATHQPADVLLVVEMAAHDRPVIPRTDQFMGWQMTGRRMNLHLRSNSLFRGWYTVLNYRAGDYASFVADVARYDSKTYPADPGTRAKWFAQKHFGDVILAPSGKALQAVRGARIAPLAVADWFAADRLTDADLIATLDQHGGTSASIADIPDRIQRTLDYQLKPVPPYFYVLQTAEKRLAVLRVLQRDSHGPPACELYIRTRPIPPAVTYPATQPATTQAASAQTVTFTFTRQEPGRPDIVSTQMIKDGRSRVELSDGPVMIQDATQGKQLFIDPQQKTAVLSKQPHLVITDLRKLANPGSTPVISVGQKQIDGHAAEGIRFAAGGETRTVWRDPITHRPMRIEIDVMDPTTHRPLHGIFSDIVFDAPLDDALFALKAPKGYVLRRSPVQIKVESVPATAPATATQPATQALAPATLDFRIAAQAADINQPQGNRLPHKLAERLVASLEKAGTEEKYDRPAGFDWFEAGDQVDPHGFITGRHDGKRYILLMTQEPYIMLAKQNGQRAWGLKQVYLDKDNDGHTALGFQFDAAGSERLGKLTESNLDRPLAILIDNKVASAPTIRSKVTDSGMIASGPDGLNAAWTRDVVAALTQGMPPTTAPSER